MQLVIGILGRIILSPSEEMVFSLAHHSQAQLASSFQGSEDHSLASMCGNTCWRTVCYEKYIKKHNVVHFKKTYIFGEYGSIIRQSEKIKAGKKWIVPFAPLCKLLPPHPVILDSRTLTTLLRWEVNASSNQSDFFHYHLWPETEKAEWDDPGNMRD